MRLSVGHYKGFNSWLVRSQPGADAITKCSMHDISGEVCIERVAHGRGDQLCMKIYTIHEMLTHGILRNIGGKRSWLKHTHPIYIDREKTNTIVRNTQLFYVA